MGIFDKAKDILGEHADQADVVVEKAGDFVDQKTDAKYVEQVDKGQAFAKERLADFDKDK
jgi:hypothetical protein